LAKSRAKKTKKSDAGRAVSPAPAKTRPKFQATKADEAQIAVHWKEEEYFRPPAGFVAQANLIDPSIVESFREDRFPECFRQYADLLSCDRYWETALDTSAP